MCDRLPLNDEAARRAIRERLDRTILVEAGAGSGKTSSMVDRMTALIATGKARTGSLAAVTFTRRAAGELRERFQESLEKSFRNCPDGPERERLGEALERLDRAFVGTIHSFCARLLRERPVEAGITPDFSEIEGLDEQILADRAWNDYLLQVRLHRPEVLRELEDLGLEPGGLKEAFLILSAQPDVDMAANWVPRPDLSSARKDVERFICEAGALVPKVMPEDGWDALQRMVRRLIRLEELFGLTSDRHFTFLLEELGKNAEGTQKRWSSREDCIRVRDAHRKLREEVVLPALGRWREYRHWRLMESFLPEAVEFYGAIRHRESLLTYGDLLMKAAGLLRDNEEVRRYFQGRYTHLLVDEFQDTDPVQAEVMMYLTGDELSERDWTRIHLRPGALFVVGDPKQSIYRFRRADIGTYGMVRDQIKRSGGLVLDLTSNFRSVQSLIRWGNEAFGDILPREPAPYQAPFAAMDEVRGETPGTVSGVLTIQLEREERNKHQLIAVQDSRRIAAWIRRCLDGGISLDRTSGEIERGLTGQPVPEDFMLLSRYKLYMAEYGRALEELGIPYSLWGGGDISGSEELMAFRTILEAVADPDNPVPLVGALRGLLFGASDDLLYRYREAGGRFSFLSDIPEGADDEVRSVLEPAWEGFRRWRRWSTNRAPDSALELIARDLGLIPLAWSGDMGKARVGYLIQALEHVRATEHGGAGSFHEAVERIGRILDQGLDEEIDIDGGRAPGVRIMNLHKAKGLESPVVILANPGRTVSPPTYLHVDRTTAQPRGFLCITQRKGYMTKVVAQPPHWDTYAREEDRYGRAEEDRLLYVAATRARNLLVVSTYPPNPAKSPWAPLERHLENSDEVEPEREAMPAGPVSAEDSAVGSMDLAGARESVAASLEGASRETYGRKSVGEMAKADASEPDRWDTGRGMSWGTVIHRMLDRVGVDGNCLDLSSLADRLLKEEGRPTEERDQVVETVRRVIGSEMWKRAMASPERLTEVPLGTWVDGAYVRGVVDLAFREGDAWVLVDYKTDAVRDEEHLEQLVEYYRPQVTGYREHWERATKERVRECGLLLISAGAYRQM